MRLDKITVSSKSYLFFTILLGMIILYPFTGFQARLAQGDHGRDLYAFQSTLEGDKPYQDYWWVYGPVMPYYYALCFKLFGLNIKSILIGQTLLKLLCGVMVFMILKRLTTPLWGTLAAIWFWHFNSFFVTTYNHTGAVLGLLVMFYYLIRCFQSAQSRHLYLGLIAIIITGCIKLNIGIVALLGFITSIFLKNIFEVFSIPVRPGQSIEPGALRPTWKRTLKKLIEKVLSPEYRYFYLTSVILIPLSLFLIHLNFLYGLDKEAIGQYFPYLEGLKCGHCFPYLVARENEPALVYKLLSSVIHFTRYNLLAPSHVLIFRAFTLLACLKVFHLLFQKSFPQKTKIPLILSIVAAVIFQILLIHEYVISAVEYRAYWQKPYAIILLFIILGTAAQNSPRIFRILLLPVIIYMLVSQAYILGKSVYLKNPEKHYLSHPKAKIYVYNHPDWIRTVDETTRYLQNHLKKSETFLAIPYDPLYYYLTDKKSPTKQMVFVAFTNISEQEEKKIISDLRNINYVLVSSRSQSLESQVGVFGKTHCLLLKSYIQENFREVASFGDWKHAPGWIYPHGTKILKRI